MNLFLKTLTLFFILFSISYAEIVKGVKIFGNDRISDETVKVYGAIKEGKSEYTKQDLDNILKKNLRNKFFQKCKCWDKKSNLSN